MNFKIIVIELYIYKYIITAFTLLLMMGFCNTYFSWYTWQDFERYATRDPEHRREREFVYKNFPMIGAQQVLYFKALNKSMRFLGPQHEVLWNIIRNVIQDVEGTCECSLFYLAPIDVLLFIYI